MHLVWYSHQRMISNGTTNTMEKHNLQRLKVCCHMRQIMKKGQAAPELLSKVQIRMSGGLKHLVSNLLRLNLWEM